MNPKIIRTCLLSLLFLAQPFAAGALDTPAAGTSYAYPLPAHQGTILSIVYNMSGSGTAQIMAFNESGDQVMNFTDIKPAGVEVSQLDLCCLSPGVYLYLVTLQYDSGAKEKLSPAKFVVIR